MDSLPKWVQGSVRPSLSITWRQDGTSTATDLSGATLSGFIRRAGVGVAIAGNLEVTDGPNGVFRWDFDAADVATPGMYEVQFVATFPVGQTPAKTFVLSWIILSSLQAG